MTTNPFEEIKRDTATGEDDAVSSADNTNDVPQESRETPQRRIEDVISPEFLQMLSEAAGGFRFRADPSLPPNRTGYTNKITRTIHYNPLLLNGAPEHGIKPWTRRDIEGFVFHESGHHAPEVVKFDEGMMEDLKNPDIIPEAYRGDPGSETRFLGALYSNLDNALADMWLESYMGRRPYHPVRASITEFQQGKGNPETYHGISKPEQLLQALLRSRYFDDSGVAEKLDPDVAAAYERIMKSGAMKALVDRSAFENYFASPADRARAIERKIAAYREVFLPEYLVLMEAELEKRKQQRQQQKQQGGDQGEPQEGGQEGESSEGQSQPGKSKGQGSKPGSKRPQPDEAGQGNEGDQEGGFEQSASVPLTKEEEQEIIEEILSELEEAGAEHQEHRVSDEEHQNAVNRALNELKKKLKERQKALESGKKLPEEEKSKPKEKTGEEALRELASQLQRESKASAQRGLAEAVGVRQESVQTWERIKETHRREINSLAANLAEVFLDDRRKRLEYLRREGEIVPGLEYETISALLSGELDPDTKMRLIQNPEFLETEIEFIVDTSGSMGGDKIGKSVEMLVIVTEALRQVRETLEAESLVGDEEHPFRIGVTKFSTVPERVSKLDDPIDNRKELKIIDAVSQVGGGTDESDALTEVYKELTLGKRNVIKIMIVLTDGQGNREAVVPIMEQIERDQEVIFMAIGLGGSKEESDAILQTYLDPLKARESNVFGHAVENTDEIIPAFVGFLKREINKRRQ